MYKKNDHPRYLPLSFLENLRNIGLNALFQLVVFIMFLHLGKRGKKEKTHRYRKQICIARRNYKAIYMTSFLKDSTVERGCYMHV